MTRADIPVTCPSCEREGTMHYLAPRLRCACGYEGPTPPSVLAAVYQQQLTPSNVHEETT